MAAERGAESETAAWAAASLGTLWCMQWQLLLADGALPTHRRTVDGLQLQSHPRTNLFRLILRRLLRGSWVVGSAGWVVDDVGWGRVV